MEADVPTGEELLTYLEGSTPPKIMNGIRALLAGLQAENNHLREQLEGGWNLEKQLLLKDLQTAHYLVGQYKEMLILLLGHGEAYQAYMEIIKGLMKE